MRKAQLADIRFPENSTSAHVNGGDTIGPSILADRSALPMTNSACLHTLARFARSICPRLPLTPHRYGN
jgi:hypothetical protein